MIEKERLQELIEQGETIYFIYNGNADEKEGIYKDDFILNETYVSIYWTTRSHQIKYQDLYETKEEAEWVEKMHTEYTEHFNPPLFENLPYEYSFKFIRNGVEHELFCKRDSYIIVISCCKDYMSGTEDMDYTKENYIKAVEMTYKLFKGEEE